MCYTMWVVVSQSSEEERAKAEDWRRREKMAEEWRRHREGWEEEQGRELSPGRSWDEEGEEPDWRPPEPYGPPGRRGKDVFLMKESEKVVRTEAGEMRLVRGHGGRMVERPLHIGFITMEPKTLFVPQYLDSSLIIFLRRGIYFFSFFFFSIISREICI